MKRLLGKLTLVFAIVGAVAMVGQTSAFATDAAVIVGQGTITPGLTTQGRTQSFTFTSIAGVGVSDKPVAADLVSCSFTGGSGTVLEDVITGHGTGNGTCSSATINVTCSITYDRVGPIVVVTGNPGPTSASCSGQIPVGVFVFVPTSVNPTTSYVLVGAAVTV